MRVGDLVTHRKLIGGGVPLITGIIIETGLVDTSDTRLEYEDLPVVMVAWDDGVCEEWEDEMEVIQGSLAELADALDLGSSVLGHPGSSPGGPTSIKVKK